MRQGEGGDSGFSRDVYPQKLRESQRAAASPFICPNPQANSGGLGSPWPTCLVLETRTASGDRGPRGFLPSSITGMLSVLKISPKSQLVTCAWLSFSAGEAEALWKVLGQGRGAFLYDREERGQAEDQDEEPRGLLGEDSGCSWMGPRTTSTLCSLGLRSRLMRLRQPL